MFRDFKPLRLRPLQNSPKTVPMRKAILRNCTSPPPIPMSATTCRLCWKVYPFPQGAAACFVQLFLYPSDFALFADAGHHVAPSEYVEHPVGIDPPVAQAFFAGIGNHKDVQAVFPPLFSHLLPPIWPAFRPGAASGNIGFLYTGSWLTVPTTGNKNL